MPSLSAPRLVVLASALAAGCSLTPIPDLTSEWQEPCEPAKRLCAVGFTLKAGTEGSAELRGSYRPDAWVAGDPMTKDGGSWTVSVEVPWDQQVQYKFLLDGNRWILDPANPKSTPDGKGNTNSVLDPLTCAKWTCAP